MARVLMPLPDRDFDVTETSVPWRLLTDAGHEVVFATERGDGPAAADPLLLTGVLFGQLGAEDEPKRFYRQMVASDAFQGPVSWHGLDPEDFDGLLLPGGHAQGMKQYLGSRELQDWIGRFWKLERPVGAICHGVLAVARSTDPDTGKPILAQRRTTCLPYYMEWLAYAITAWKLGNYYRTYPDYVETEVRGALADPDTQFERGPITLISRGTVDDDTPAFVVEDGHYVSARWPGDSYLFARQFAARL